MQQPLPTHLQHEPVFAFPYFDSDGPYAGATDAHFLTLGIAQWDRKSLSAKVMRNKGERWIRNSEELPIHRVLDLAKIVAMATGYRFGGHVPMPGSEGTVDVINERRAAEVADRLRTDPFVQTRLNELADCLKALGYGS